MNFVCVLKTGGIYTAAHVERLRAMLWKPVICLTDDPEVTEPKLPLVHGWKGWWSKLELFEHDFGHVCYLDLDVTVNHLDWLNGLDPAQFYIMEDAFKPGGCHVNSSVMVWDGPRPDLVNVTDKEMEHPGGDQDWIWKRLQGKFKFLNPPDVVSYKKHGAKPENGVVVYHGLPKPWDSDAQVKQRTELTALLPNSTLDRLEQYKLAWTVLNRDNISESTLGCMAHAKCWLTYRAIDGEITLADWQEKIKPVQPEEIANDHKRGRWKSSQETAEIYLAILHDLTWTVKAETQFQRIIRGVELTPWNATNYMRIMALYSYSLYLEKCPTAKEIANESILAWQRMWQNVKPEKSTLRYAELGLVSYALYIMSRLLITEEQPLTKWNWADAAAIKETTPWARCLTKLSDHPRGFWAPPATE
jgi:hypothetical protein